MNCKNPINYIIRRGDTLFRIAAHYHTTVAQILAVNPGLDPLNLQIGQVIIVCVGEDFFAPPPAFPVPPIGTLPPVAPQPPITPAPPIFPLPPITPVPPIFPLPPVLVPPIAPPIFPPRPPIGTFPPIFIPPVNPVPPIGEIPSMCHPCSPCPPIMPLSSGMSNCDKKNNLLAQMRLAWSQHIYWTRMLLISIANGSKDKAATQARLLQNPKDIADIFAPFYGQDAARTIENLLTEHLKIGGDIMVAVRDGQKQEVERLLHLWYKNADEMAAAFASLNPNYNQKVLQDMLDNHLDLTTDEVNKRMAGNYSADIDAFNKIEAAAMDMSDYFSQGIMTQFPNRF